MNTTARKAQIAEFKHKLASDRRWVRRALIVLHERQTSDEQRDADTRWLNHEGFTAADAKLLTSFAQQILRGRELSDKQVAWAFCKMPKYAKQLVGIAESKQAA